MNSGKRMSCYEIAHKKCQWIVLNLLSIDTFIIILFVL